MDPSVYSLYQHILTDASTSHRQKRQLLRDARQLLPSADNRRSLGWVIWPLALVGIVSENGK